MAEAAKAQGVPPEPRVSFLTDPFTSRDLFGVCRGRCLQCTDCGKYLKATSDYTITAGDQGRRHPDNDPSITRCSRCGCPPEAHEAAEHEQERELGNDAFALKRYDAAVAHYSRALGLCSTDAALWSNRAAAYLAKGWPQQALHDAEHALALRPDWPKAWGRKAAALLQLGRPAAAVEAYQRALQLEQGQGEASGGSAALRDGLRQARAALAKQQRAAAPAQQRQQQLQQAAPQTNQRQQQQQHPHAPKPAPVTSAALPKVPGAPQAGLAGAAPPAAVHASNAAATPPQQRVSTAAQPVTTGPASSAPAQQHQPQVQAPGLMAAWQSLQQQATEATAVLAQLQQQMQAFERLLLAAQQRASKPQQEAQPPCQGTSAASVASEFSGAAVSAEGSQDPPAAGTAGAASVPSPDTAAPLEGSPGSPSSGLGSSFASLGSLPSSPTAAPSFVQEQTGSPAGLSGRGTAEDACGGGRGSSSGDSDSDSDSGVEEVYSEMPPATGAAAAGAGGMQLPVPAAPPSSGADSGHSSKPEAAREQVVAPPAPPIGSGKAGQTDGQRTKPGSSTPPRMAGSPSSGSSSSDDESSRSSGDACLGSDDDAWLASVEAARRRLAAEGARVVPPAKAGRRAPKPAQAAGAADGGLSSLRQMCADAEAAAMAVDGSGTPRAACKQCGDSCCPRFRPAGALSEDELAAVLAQQAATDGGFTKPDACVSCGCPSSAHETPREFATRQARERRQRLRAQRQANGTASSAAGASAAAAAASQGSAFQAEALDDRQRRVAAAAQRRAEAEATGDLLQDSDCDMLTQQRRTTCGGCSACPGFRLLFRGCDANDPEVMFYCSACGCRSDQHAVDPEWQRHEAARRAAEAAASERRQAAGAAGSGAAAAAARKAEAEAFAMLGLPLGADAKSINRAYKRLALQLHPDKQQRASRAEAEAAAARFVRVADAYKLLSGS